MADAQEEVADKRRQADNVRKVPGVEQTESEKEAAEKADIEAREARAYAEALADDLEKTAGGVAGLLRQYKLEVDDIHRRVAGLRAAEDQP